jgi:hypothetical protein
MIQNADASEIPRPNKPGDQKYGGLLSHTFDSEVGGQFLLSNQTSLDFAQGLVHYLDHDSNFRFMKKYFLILSFVISVSVIDASATGVDVGRSIKSEFATNYNPIVVLRMGDSMANDLFDSTLRYFDLILKTNYGNAGTFCRALDVNTYNPSTMHQYQAYNRFYNAQASGIKGDTNNPKTPSYLYPAQGGGTLYASDGTNAAGASYTGTPINQIGFWWWAQPQGGTLSALFAGTSVFTLSVNGYSEKPVLLHTNVCVADSTNWNIWFTSVSGTNYILGWDNVCTNCSGIAEMSWSMGGLDLNNIIGTALGYNNYSNMFSILKPRLLLIESRDNGPAETSATISNQVFRLAQIVTNANRTCSVVTVSPPFNHTPELTYPDAQNIAFRSLSIHGSPFYNVALDTVFTNLAAATSFGLGLTPHPTPKGGYLTALEMIKQLGFEPLP